MSTLDNSEPPAAPQESGPAPTDTVAASIRDWPIEKLREVLLREWADAEARVVVDCFDCGRAYGSDGWVECIVPDEDWRAISPSGNEGGILCIICIARRLKRMGRDRVPAMLCGTEAIRPADQDEAFERGWGAAKSRIEELESQVTQLTEELARSRGVHFPLRWPVSAGPTDGRT